MKILYQGATEITTEPPRVQLDRAVGQLFTSETENIFIIEWAK